jgi:multidrug efflux system outer membrane protein
LNNLFTGPARVWSYAEIAGPIFTFGAVSGQVAQAEGAQQSALYSYRAAIQNAADVELARGEQKLQRSWGAQGALSPRSKITRGRDLQYNGGYTSYTTVLQAEQSLFPAELTLASLRASVFSSSVNIYKAMGGGWIVEADEMTGDTAPPPADRSTGMPSLF